MNVLGSGGYADDNIGTVSTTGYGDAILRYNVAQRILSAMEQGNESVQGLMLKQQTSVYDDFEAESYRGSLFTQQKRICPLISS